MKVYRIRTNVNSYQYFLTAKEEDVLTLVCDGSAKAEDWVPPPVFVYKPKLKSGDFFNFSLGMLITSPHATKLLRPFLEVAGELLPLPYKGEIFTLLNVTECIDCLDQEATEWFIDSFTHQKAYPTKYVFNQERFSSSRLFKIPETASAEILIVDKEQGNNEEFRSVVAHYNLQGLIFEELWNETA